MKMREKIRTKNRTMATVRTATRVALVFSRSSSFKSSRRDPRELSDSLLWTGVAGSKELSEIIVATNGNCSEFTIDEYLPNLLLKFP